MTGLGVAFGPLIGGAVVEGRAWQWVFWINVPVGIVLVPLALLRLPSGRSIARLPGLALVILDLLGVVWGLVRGNREGWASPEIVGPIAADVLLLVAFVGWESRTAEPMRPLRLFRNRGFSASNATALPFSFGMFGSILLLSQFLQTVEGASPLEADLKMLPWVNAIREVGGVFGVAVLASVFSGRGGYDSRSRTSSTGRPPRCGSSCSPERSSRCWSPACAARPPSRPDRSPCRCGPSPPPSAERAAARFIRL